MGTIPISPRIIQYYDGRGKLHIGPEGGRYSKTATDAEGFRWLGNVSAIELTPTRTLTQHIESYSGENSPDRDVVTSQEITGTMTLEDVAPENWALAGIGDVNDVAAASVSDEDIGDPLLDTIVKLEGEGISNLVITDSATVPNTLPSSQYTLSAGSGMLRITDKTTGGPYVKPFLASYDKEARKRVSMLTRETTVRNALVFDGLNTQEVDANGDPLNVTVFLYSVALLPGQVIPLISAGIQGFQVAFSARIDTTKLDSDSLGKFGFISVTVPPEDA